MAETLHPLPAEDLFCTNLPTLPKVWDSVMLGLLKECPRKFKYVIIDGWQSPGFAAHLAFGIAYHKVLEEFDRHRFTGMEYNDAMNESAKFAMNYGARGPDGKFNPYDAFYTREPTKTRDTLIRATVWYLENFRNDSLQTVRLADGSPAVEQSFKLSLELPSPDGDPFLLAGHLDRVVIDDNGDYFDLDRKTTKGEINARYWSQFNPNNQISLYYFATQSVLRKPAKGVIIDAAQLGVNFVRFRRHLITLTKGVQQEWVQDLYSYLSLATDYASRDYWPKNDKSCTNYGGCPFQFICSKDPAVREQFISHEGFLNRKWNPLENR